jgi:hypothetical protein
MNEFIIKNFKKKEAVKVYFIGQDKKVKVKWLLSEDNKVEFDNKTYLILPEKIYFHKGITCMFVNSHNAEPIDINNIDYHVKTAKDFNDALGAKVVQDLIMANKKKETINMSIILSFLAIGVSAFIIYSMNGQFKEILEVLAEINRLLGGGLVE